MSHEIRSSSNKKKQPARAVSGASQGASSEVVSPWVLYLTGKKVSPGAFLRKMEADKAKTGITVPGGTIKSQFAEALVANPDRIVRLLALLQACGAFSETLQRIILNLVQVSIDRFGIDFVSDSLGKAGFRDGVSSWLDAFPKKPLKKVELLQLFLLLQFGWHRGIVDHDTSVALIGQALSPSAKGRGKEKKAQKAPQPPLAALLGASPNPAVLSALLVYAKAASEEKAGLSSRNRSQAADIERLTNENKELDAQGENLKSEINALQSKIAAAENEVDRVQRQVVDLRDGYRHKMDDLRGQIRGMLQGQLTRWLQTALDASRTDPPWTVAIQERLEDALQLIEKESKCLQPSE